MGCGPSVQNGNGAKEDGKYKTAADDADSEGELSDVDAMSEGSATSETSTTSSRSITRVTTTRGWMASSSTSMPKPHQPVYEPGMDPNEINGGVKRKVQAFPAKPVSENFLFGDFNVDPKDVVRLRVERLNRVRRPSRHFSDEAAVRPAGNMPKSMEVFILNDFVVNAMEDDDELPSMSAASIPVPTGFRRLTGMTVKPLIGHTDRVKALVLGREEKSFLSAGITDSVVSMADLTGQELNCYPGHDAYIVALALSRDGKLFASSARDGTIAVWEYSTNREHAMKKQVRTFAADEAQNAISISLAFANDNRFLIAGGQDGCCRVWEIDRAGHPLVYERHSNVIVSVAAHPTEPLVASASGDKTIHVWNYETGEASLRITGHEGAVLCVAFTLDGKRILSNDDRSCRLWSSETGDLELTVKLDAIVTSSGHHPAGSPTTKGGSSSKAKSAAAAAAAAAAATAAAATPFVKEDCPVIKVLQNRYPKFAERLEQALSGTQTTASRAAQMERVTARTIFTVSAMLPGALSSSYFAVACTTGEAYIVNAVTGMAEGAVHTKAPVFTMHAGVHEKLLLGDIFGNVYLVAFTAEHKQ